METIKNIPLREMIEIIERPQKIYDEYRKEVWKNNWSFWPESWKSLFKIG